MKSRESKVSTGQIDRLGASSVKKDWSYNSKPRYTPLWCGRGQIWLFLPTNPLNFYTYQNCTGKFTVTG
jgi:hypothetical protein